MTYPEFIAISTYKNINIQYDLDVKGSDKYYYIYAFDGQIKYEVEINSLDNPSNVSDFETNYLPIANRPISPTIITQLDGDSATANVPLPPSNRIRKHVYDATPITESCGETTFVDFYVSDFSPYEVYFQELFIYPYNDHHLRYVIDGYDSGIVSLLFYESCFADIASPNISLSPNNLSLRLNLNNVKGSEIIIQQKRRTGGGTGNLTMYGYILIYDAILP